MVSDVTSQDDQGNSVRKSRIAKARRFMLDRKSYMRDVVKSIKQVITRAHKEGLIPCIRLNGSTDIAWEGIACEVDGVPYRNLMEAFPSVQFVDYTKNHMRLKRKLPANYHLTLSRHENNEALALNVISSGHNVAIVFDSVPQSYKGFPVIDGDLHDLRHLDPRGVIVGLSPKGRMAKKDNTIKINGEIYKLKFLLGRDMKFLHTVMGLSACNSNLPCLWCKWHKDFFSKLGTIPEILTLKRTTQEQSAHLKRENAFLIDPEPILGYAKEPILDFSEFEDCVFDTLHMLLRIVEKLMKLF
jgi:hypothetical protein